MLKGRDGENEIEIVIGQLGVKGAHIIVYNSIVGGRELDGPVAESFALVGVPAFVIVGEELEDTTVASANIENPGTRRHIEANKAIDQVILIDLQVANGGIRVADIVRLKGQPQKSSKCESFEYAKSAIVAGVGQIGRLASEVMARSVDGNSGRRPVGGLCSERCSQPA
jgi:hypothetical protein